MDKPWRSDGRATDSLWTTVRICGQTEVISGD
jgi:hypothetical protein